MENFGLAVETAVKMKSAVWVSCARCIGLTDEKDILQWLREIEEVVGTVGMKQENGNFYPGFFAFPSSFRNKTKISDPQMDSKENVKPDFFDFEFVARGSIDEDGFYCDYSRKFPNHREKFPSLSSVAVAQLRKKAALAGKRFNDKQPDNNTVTFSEYRFSLLEGYELDLSKIFASGLWYTTETQEFFFAGVYDTSERFVCAFCISKDGFFIPGCTDQRRKFFPLSHFGAKEHKPVHYRNASKRFDREKAIVLKQIAEIPLFPRSSVIHQSPNWFCFKNKAIVDNPAEITVHLDYHSIDNESINVYIGGMKGPDKRLYLYGKQDKVGFSSGILIVITFLVIKSKLEFVLSLCITELS